MSDRLTVARGYAINAQDIPVISVPRLWANVGNEITKILPAAPVRKPLSIAFTSRFQLIREFMEHPDGAAPNFHLSRFQP